jgi:hypothetical protein
MFGESGLRMSTRATLKLDSYEPTIHHGNLGDHLAGFEFRIGTSESQDPIMNQLENEHLEFRHDFISSNYNIETNSENEWNLVTRGYGAFERTFRHNNVEICRRIPAFFWGVPGKDGYLYSEIADAEMRSKKVIGYLAVENDLSIEQVIVVLLYTGPMFTVYNALLENFPENVAGSFRGGFRTTIAVIVSALEKLAKRSVENGGLFFASGFYRGNSGHGKVPHEFMEEKEGIAMFGFLSTSTRLEVGLQYSGATQGRPFPSMFHLHLDTTTCPPASVQALSQFPHEIEFIFPPLSFLLPLLFFGRPRVTYHSIDGKEVPIISATIHGSYKTSLNSSAVLVLPKSLRNMDHAAWKSHSHRADMNPDHWKYVESLKSTPALLIVWVHDDISSWNAIAASSLEASQFFIRSPAARLQHSTRFTSATIVRPVTPAQMRALIARSSMTGVLIRSLLAPLTGSENHFHRIKIARWLARAVHTRQETVLQTVDQV